MRRLTGEYPGKDCSDTSENDETVNHLITLPEFNCSYDEDSMERNDFITFGEVQRTISQFYEARWKGIENISELWKV